MPATIFPQVQTLIEAPLLRLTRCWRITRSDGVIELWTEHLSELTVWNETFTPADFEATASEANAGFENNNVELRGAFNNTKITKADAKARIYDNARVVVLWVDYLYPFSGFVRADTFIVDSVQYTNDIFKCDVLSLPGILTRKTGRTLNRDCDAEVYGSRCKLVRSTHAEAGVVSAVTDKRRFVATITAGGGLPAIADGRFDLGEIDWLTGNNVGFTSDVKTSTISGSDSTLALQMRAPREIQIGDTFNIFAGCNQTLDDCLGQSGSGARPWLSNKVNHKGFPNMPGTTTLTRTP